MPALRNSTASSIESPVAGKRELPVARFRESGFSKALASLVFLATIFPYVTPLETPFDTQPYALILALLFVVHASVSTGIFSFQIPRYFLILVLILAVALVRFFEEDPDFGSLRSLVGYVTIVAIGLASYHGFALIKPKLFVVCMGIWFGVAVVQTTFWREFGGVLLSRMSTTADRGITGLAVEPSYLAICCVFFLLLNDFFSLRAGYGERAYRAVFVMLVLQVFMAASSLGFILLFVYLLSRLIAQRQLLGFVRASAAGAVLFVVSALAFAVVPSLAAGRASQLIEKLSAGPQVLIFTDASIAERLLDVIVAPISLGSHGGMGFGLDAWATSGQSVIEGAGEFVHKLTLVDPAGHSERLMSGWGAAIFELGLVGVGLVLIFLMLANRSVRHSAGIAERRITSASAITIFVMMMIAVPLAFPLFGYFIGIFFAIANRPPGLVELSSADFRLSGLRLT